MSFLDNSGDIILDAVLTDAGRQRIARGQFKIVKFALGDEEVNYNLFNSSHPSGSAFYDLKVMQTPVLEAFTNNSSMMKSKLVTMLRNNILYMPIFKVNNFTDNKTKNASSSGFEGFYLTADVFTETAGSLEDPILELKEGFLRGHSGVNSISGDLTRCIAIDQGINTNEGSLSFKQEIDPELVETAFLIRVDHRLLRIHGPIGGAGNADRFPIATEPMLNQFVDDDGVATYYTSLGDGFQSVETAPVQGGGVVQFPEGRRRDEIVGLVEQGGNPLTRTTAREMFDGPLGSILRIYPRTTHHVQQSHALFDEIGSTGTFDFGSLTNQDATKTVGSYKFIDTLINIVGVTTGYSIDIPIRIIKKTVS